MSAPVKYRCTVEPRDSVLVEDSNTHVMLEVSVGHTPRLFLSKDDARALALDILRILDGEDEDVTPALNKAAEPEPHLRGGWLIIPANHRFAESIVDITHVVSVLEEALDEEDPDGDPYTCVDVDGGDPLRAPLEWYAKIRDLVIGGES